MQRKVFDKLEEVSRCDICGSKDIRPLSGVANIRLCSNCDFVFASPRPMLCEIIKSYSDADFYYNWIKENQGRKVLWKKRYQRVAQYFKQKSVLLDFSAGIGTFLGYAKKDGHEVYGTEISASAKRIALETYGIVLEDESTLLSRNHMQYYDLITAWHVLEHVESPSALLGKLYVALKDSGYLVVAVPNNMHRTLKQIFFFRSNIVKNLYPVLVPGEEIHLSHFNENTLKNILRKNGFAEIYVGIDDHFANPNLKNWIKYRLYCLIRKITGVNLSETIFVVAKKISC